MGIERRSGERVRYTFRKYLKRWIDLSLPRKIVASVVVAAGVGGTSFAACRGSDIAGPSAPTASAPSVPGPSRSLVDAEVPELPSLFAKEDEEIAKANPDFVTSTETTFETTEAVYNECANEMPVLNGYIKTREKTSFDGLTLRYKLHVWKDTRGVAATATAYWDDDNDELTPKKAYTVRYHNQERAFDKFEVGPAGLPFKSFQQSRIHLRREGDSRKQFPGGDDLFVYASHKIIVDANGVTHERFQFRAECK